MLLNVLLGDHFTVLFRTAGKGRPRTDCPASGGI